MLCQQRIRVYVRTSNNALSGEIINRGKIPAKRFVYTTATGRLDCTILVYSVVCVANDIMYDRTAFRVKRFVHERGFFFFVYGFHLYSYVCLHADSQQLLRVFIGKNADVRVSRACAPLPARGLRRTY